MFEQDIFIHLEGEESFFHKPSQNLCHQRNLRIQLRFLG